MYAGIALQLCLGYPLDCRCLKRKLFANVVFFLGSVYEKRMVKIWKKRKIAIVFCWYVAGAFVFEALEVQSSSVLEVSLGTSSRLMQLSVCLCDCLFDSLTGSWQRKVSTAAMSEVTAFTNSFSLHWGYDIASQNRSAKVRWKRIRLIVVWEVRMTSLHECSTRDNLPSSNWSLMFSSFGETENILINRCFVTFVQYLLM